MKYEEILRWRQDVYDATVGALAIKAAVSTPSRRLNTSWSITQADNGAPPTLDWQPPQVSSNLPLPGHQQQQQQRNDSSVSPTPEPVPASLAPAHGQVPAMSLKRPISGSFSSAVSNNQHPVSNILNEIDRAASAAAGVTETGSSNSNANEHSPPNYALGLADTQMTQQPDFAQPRQGYEFPPLQRLRLTNRV